MANFTLANFLYLALRISTLLVHIYYSAQVHGAAQSIYMMLRFAATSPHSILCGGWRLIICVGFLFIALSLQRYCGVVALFGHAVYN